MSQAFPLSVDHRNEHAMQRIIHRQEQPPFTQEAIYETSTPIQGVIWIYLEDGKQTMLFPEEK